MTHEQAYVLELIKRKHTLQALAEDSVLGGKILSGCVSDSFAFQCSDCLMVFTVEPDGETDVWEVVD